MNIAIIGTGKIGKGIQALLPKDWKLLLACDAEHPLEKAPKETLSNIDLFFEFTEPKASRKNINFICGSKKGTKIVCGTTGWNIAEVKDKVMETGALLLHSANFSLGINAINNLVANLSKDLSTKNGFKVSMSEYHHVHKKDSPSGTAKMLVATIESNGQKCPITSFREGEIPGIHIIQFKSEFETVEIKHEVSSRQVFCAGAIAGAEWLLKQNRPGIYNSNDVIA